MRAPDRRRDEAKIGHGAGHEKAASAAMPSGRGENQRRVAQLSRDVIDPQRVVARSLLNKDQRDKPTHKAVMIRSMATRRSFRRQYDDRHCRYKCCLPSQYRWPPMAHNGCKNHATAHSMFDGDTIFTWRRDT